MNLLQHHRTENKRFTELSNGWKTQDGNENCAATTSPALSVQPLEKRRLKHIVHVEYRKDYVQGAETTYEVL